MGSANSSENAKKPVENSLKTNKSSSTIPEKRSFNKEYYYTDFKEYHSKEETKFIIAFLKKKVKTAKVRSVTKNSSVYLYFDEDSFKQIKSGDINLPMIEQIPQDKNKDQNGNLTKPQHGLDSQERINKQQQKQSQKQSQKQLKKQSQNQSQNQSQTTQVDEIKKKQTHDDTRNTQKTDTATSLNHNVIKKQMEDFLINSSEFPSYLLSRLSKEAQTIMKIRLLDIENLPRKKLERCIDVLRTEQVKYDIRFDKEKDIIDYMNNLSKLMNVHLQKLMESESEQFVQNFIIEPLKEGKFDKQLDKMEKKGIDEVSYLIFKTLKGKAKKYPFTETHLIKKIHIVLEERGKKENKENKV